MATSRCWSPLVANLVAAGRRWSPTWSLLVTNLVAIGRQWWLVDRQLNGG